MDELDAIERLFTLKNKGLLTDEEFASEKAKVLAGTKPQASDLAAPEALAIADGIGTAGYERGYKTGRKNQILTAFALLSAIAVCIWWFAKSPITEEEPKPIKDEPTREPLGTYILGGWAPYQEGLTVDEMCGTDGGWTFHADGSFSSMDYAATWVVKDDGAVIIDDGNEKYDHSVERIDRDHYQFDNLKMVRCPTLP